MSKKTSQTIDYIEWLDHYSSKDTAWRSKDDLQAPYELKVYSVGRVISENKLGVTLAPSWTTDGDNYHSPMTIMKKLITKRRTLK